MTQEQSDKQQLDEADWDITPDGLYIATRGFLVRRGYCCANKCRNCPYINWRENPAWQPIPHEYVRRMRVSIKAIEGVQTMLHLHEDALQRSNEEDYAYHQAMIEHYRFLLAQWKQTGA